MSRSCVALVIVHIWLHECGAAFGMLVDSLVDAMLVGKRAKLYTEHSRILQETSSRRHGR